MTGGSPQFFKIPSLRCGMTMCPARKEGEAAGAATENTYNMVVLRVAAPAASSPFAAVCRSFRPKGGI